jgi:predicted secreted protein
VEQNRFEIKIWSLGFDLKLRYATVLRYRMSVDIGIPIFFCPKRDSPASGGIHDTNQLRPSASPPPSPLPHARIQMISVRSLRAIYLRSPDRVVGSDCFHEIPFSFVHYRRQ